MPEACLTITVVGTPQWEVRNIRVSSNAITLGQSVTVSAEIYNVGSGEGTAAVGVTLNGVMQGQYQIITLNPNQYRTVTFTVTPQSVGSHRICIFANNYAGD